MKYLEKYENENIEFKISLGQLDKGLEALSAMINKNGYGKVVYGVNDDAEIIGLKDIGRETIKKIGVRINEAINPKIVPTISLTKYEDKTILEVEVKANNKPYACFGNYLIRVGSENKKIMPKQLGDLFFTNSNLVAEKIESINQDLTFYGLKRKLPSNLYAFG